MADWFFTSDLHGQGALYEQLLGMAATRRPRAVLIGGDLSPHDVSANGVASQRVFLEGFFTEFARRLHEAVPGVELLLIMGNDDWAANHEFLERGEGGLWRCLHERVVRVDGVAVAGLSWVPITPFVLKDWERWDDGGEALPRARFDGHGSRTGSIAPIRFDAGRRSPTIAEALDALAASTPPGETVFVSHSPPHGTRCDMLAASMHAGSRALRAFVERHQPPVVLSGHIHESPRGVVVLPRRDRAHRDREPRPVRGVAARRRVVRSRRRGRHAAAYGARLRAGTAPARPDRIRTAV